MTLSSGHSASYLTGAVGTGRESYYTGAVTDGEPPGRWYGRGAERLGLRGLVDHQDMEAVFAKFIDPRDEHFRTPDRWDQAALLGARPPRYTESAEDRLAELLKKEPAASPERVEALKLQASKGGRSAVMFYDATLSVQKSITVLHTSFARMEAQARQAGDEQVAAQWATHREAVEAAIWAGNRAGMDYLQDRAGYSRVGHHGGSAGRWADAHDWTIASFFQHTNRDDGPQLHIHNAILNRVECPDGTFRAIDGQALYAERPAAAAIAERVTEEHLTATLGVVCATRPDGKAREVVGISQDVLDLFSTRRRAISAKAEELVRNFAERYQREPNNLERAYLSQQATLATRRAKSHVGKTTGERLDGYDRELRTLVAEGLEGVARSVLGRAGYVPEETFSPTAVLETALAEVQESRSSWTRADLIRAVTAALPDSLGGMEAGKLRGLVEGLADRALSILEPDPTIPDGGQPGGAVTLAGAVSLTHRVAAVVPNELRLADGRSAYSRPGSQRFATRDQLAAERALRDAAVERGAASVDQLAAANYVERLEAELALQDKQLGADQRRAIFGVLTSGAKVETLVGPAGAGKSFVLGALADGWTELVGGRVLGLATSQIATEVLKSEGLDAVNIAAFLLASENSLQPNDLVVVDESGMTSTADLEAIRRLVDRAGAKLLPTGDFRQLAAVGAGGAFKLLTEAGISYELTEVRRFDARWEREASLALRAGEPESLLAYQRHGRLVDGGTFEQAAHRATRAYLGDVLDGKKSLLVVDTNEQAGTVSGQIRAELVRLGRVNEAGVTLGLDGNRAGVGDVVQARLNARKLAGYAGNPRGPINREMYRVTETRGDGELVVVDEAGNRITLPAGYVAQHLALGYAVTVHGAQGQTVDTGHQLVTGSTRLSALYPGMTRGRQSNTAYVETIRVGDDAKPGEAHDVERRPVLGVLGDILEAGEDDQAALAHLEESAAQARNVGTIVELFADAVQLVQAGRVEELLDKLVTTEDLTPDQRAAVAADPSMPVLARLVRSVELAGHDPESVLLTAIHGRPLDDARNLAHLLHYRITESLQGQLAPAGETFADRVPAVGGIWEERLRQLAEVADERRRELGFEVAETPTRWAIEALGPVPADVIARQEWEHRAGVIAAERERAGLIDDAQAIGPAPKLGEHEARASWYAAWRALGRPEADREEAELSDGQLRLRVRAYDREEAWAPSWVADDLEQASREEAELRQEAAIARESGDVERAGELGPVVGKIAAERARLEQVDEARAEWYAHTAATRVAAERAREELANRGRDVGAEEDRVTAEEWLAEHEAAMKDEDPHRPVFEVDVAEESSVETGELDGVDEKSSGEELATIAETASVVLRAQAALAELDNRRDLEERRAREDAEQAISWETEDHVHIEADEQLAAQ